jgi:hypothetical protein
MGPRCLYHIGYDPLPHPVFTIGDWHRPGIQTHPFPHCSEHRFNALGQRQRDKAAAAVSDERLQSVTVFGDAATCRARLEQFRRNGADLPVIAYPHGPTLPALVPQNAGAAPAATS